MSRVLLEHSLLSGLTTSCGIPDCRLNLNVNVRTLVWHPSLFACLIPICFQLC